MAERYPGYDVLAKRHTPSWNEQTRRVVDERLAVPREPRFFGEEEFATLDALCDRIVPQPRHRPPIPIGGADRREDAQERGRRLPQRQAAADGRGLAAGPQGARRGGAGRARARVPRARRRGPGRPPAGAAATASCERPAWGGMPSDLFFKERVLHGRRPTPTTPTRPPGARSGWAGRPARAATCGWASTAATRGRRSSSRTAATRRRCGGRTAVSADPMEAPRAKDGRAPDVFRPGGWVPMRAVRRRRRGRLRHRRHRGGRRHARLQAGGGRLLRRGARRRPVLAAARGLRLGRDWQQTKLYWTDERIVDGENPLQLGSNNSGKSVGGSTVHFAMVSLRFRPEWFKSRSLLGYGADWPLDWREMWRYYGEVEEALKVAGPVSYPWGPKRPRYPYRAARGERRRPGAREGLRGARHRLGADAARHPLGPARRGASLRLSRLLHARLLDQRQAERARHLAAARARRRRRDPRPRDGRTDRGRRRGPGDRRPLPPRGPLALPEGPQRRRGRLRDRDAAPAAQLRHRPPSRRGSPTARAWSAST